MATALLVDAHCHLSSPRFASVLANVIGRARAKGLSKIAVSSVCEEDWIAVARLARQYEDFIVPQFGIHPWWADTVSTGYLDKLKEYLEEFPQAGVGEIGLDKSRKGSAVPLDIQLDVLRDQATLAQTMHRLITIHCVSAHGKVFECLRAVGTFPAGILYHSYSGSEDMVKSYTQLGPSWFSLSAGALSKRSTKLATVAKAVPKDMILIETDAPDQLPAAEVLNRYNCHAETTSVTEADYGRGSTAASLNEPCFLDIALTELAEIRQVEVQNLAEQLNRNATKAFFQA